MDRPVEGAVEAEAQSKAPGAARAQPQAPATVALPGLMAQVPEGTRQALVVTTDGWEATAGVLRRVERDGPGASWVTVGEEVPVEVGRAGLAWGRGLHRAPEGAALKREGDGKAPAGIFALGRIFGLGEQAPEGMSMPYLPIVEGTECVDDPASMHYNRVVNRYRVGVFDWESSEVMASMGAVYALGLEVAHNAAPVEAGGGSCIFLHIHQGPGVATAGCTSMARPALEEALRWLEPSKAPVLVQAPTSE